MFVSTAVILVGLWAASTGNIKEVDLARTFTVPLLFAPPLAAPLLFDYLVSGSNIFDGRF
jgi:hypothetical protein